MVSVLPSPVRAGVCGLGGHDVAAAPLLPPSAALQTQHQPAAPPGPQGQLHHDRQPALRPLLRSLQRTYAVAEGGLVEGGGEGGCGGGGGRWG